MLINESDLGYIQNVMERPLDNPVASLENPMTQKVHYFPFNINSLNWSYQINVQSYDTYGGRVTQILSARATTMTLQGQAGSRKKLLDLYGVFKDLQNDQNQNKKAMKINVPSRSLSYTVWLNQMSIAWDVTTLAYPYAMSFEIQQDVSTTKVPIQAAISTALDRIAEGIGYNTNWNGMNPTQVNLQYSDVKDFANIIKAYGGVTK